ncbi:MAG: hypothetical protein RR642_17090, partial [Solibacillus sp.]
PVTSCDNAFVINIVLTQAPADVTDFLEEFFERVRKKIWTKLRRGVIYFTKLVDDENQSRYNDNCSNDNDNHFERRGIIRFYIYE